ncbi:dUTPase [Proteus phage Stubb]|uniref:dUTP diphosphatase n=1 Tax=Proteus phage Stubb TaxID=2315597 RepID=A0A3B8DX95_9CAUD|nr:dUTPase [Proteus phage Stubb]AYJ73267.1 deoxi-UTP pyrophosphatase [Proteus phage Stubb]UXY92357.1 deoxyuridine 5'-triphosphate nucleotidohydrolase [Proteus phage RP7]
MIRMHLKNEKCKPHIGSAGAAAMDLRIELGDERNPASEMVVLSPGQSISRTTGVSVEIPEGWCAMIIPRSGLGTKGIEIMNTVGLIDSDYRGEIGITVRNKGKEDIVIGNYDRIAQMVIVPHMNPHCVEYVSDISELSDTARGASGFGSSGIK